jgi:PAS domain S-box-containing protein
MAVQPRPRVTGILCALAATAVAALAHGQCLAPAGRDAPLFFLVAAVTVSAWYGGLYAGLLATGLGWLLGFCGPWQPFGWVRLGGSGEPVQAALFLALGLLVSGLSEGLHGARRRAELAAREAGRQRDRLAAEIAARWHAEQEAARDRLMFERMAEATPDILFVYDLRQHRGVYCNRQVERVLGYSTAEILSLGRGLADLVHPDDLPRVRAEAAGYAGLAEGQVLEMKFRMRHAAGGYRLLHLRQVVFSRDNDGRLVRFLGLAQDVTEARRVEEELRDSEQRFARFMQHLPGLAWAKDLQGRYVFANDAAEKAFRRTRSELYGRTDDEVFPPATAAQFKVNDRRALESGAGVTVVESLPHEDGVLHHSVVSKFPIAGIDGRVMMVGGMAIDITDRLRAEEALREADRHKDEFLATLAHELRNPLAPVRNGLEVLQKVGVSGEAAAVCEMMDRQLRQLTRLVDDLLDVSRITRGKIKLQRERVALVEVLRRAIETSRPLLDERNHTLSVTLPPGDLYLDADPARLSQVVANLLNNAAKYTDEGGRIILSAGREGGQAVIRVRDSGVGIPGEMLPRVFDLFTQADRTLDRSQGGLGIGLTLVKSLVEMHGGEVTAHSEGPGRGSEFLVRLPTGELSGKTGPAAPQTAPAFAGVGATPRLQPGPSEDGRAEPVTPHKGRRILVVDDNADSALSLALLLRLGGHEVRTALDGESGLHVAREFRPQVVLLDIGLPRMDGYEVARRLRAEEKGAPRLLVLAMTGYGQDEDRRRSREAGCDHHLVKPVDPDELRRLLATAPVGEREPAPLPPSPPKRWRGAGGEGASFATAE